MGYTGASDLTPMRMRLDFVSECDGRNLESAFTLTGDDENGDREVLCYAGLEVDDNDLEYFYVPRGSRHAFRRAARNVAATR